MSRSSTSITLAVLAFMAFAGQVHALSIQFGGALGNITASQLLAFPQGPEYLPCQSQCNTANITLLACGDENDTCLCTQGVADMLQVCEECLYTQLIDMNTAPADPRIGSTPALAAFTAACMSGDHNPNNNITDHFVLTPEVLSLPSTWVGPESIQLNTAATVVVVAVGAAMGFSFLYLLANIA